MTKRISKSLIRNETEEGELTQRFIENEDLLIIINSVLQDKLKASRDVQVSKTGYGSPNWAYEQADANAVQRTLTEIIDLLTLKE